MQLQVHSSVRSGKTSSLQPSSHTRRKGLLCACTRSGAPALIFSKNSAPNRERLRTQQHDLDNRRCAGRQTYSRTDPILPPTSGRTPSFTNPFGVTWLRFWLSMRCWLSITVHLLLLLFGLAQQLHHCGVDISFAAESAPTPIGTAQALTGPAACCVVTIDCTATTEVR